MAADFFTIEAWTPRGLQRLIALLLMELLTRKLEIAGSQPWGIHALLSLFDYTGDVMAARTGRSIFRTLRHRQLGGFAHGVSAVLLKVFDVRRRKEGGVHGYS